MKLWTSLLSGQLDALAESYNASIRVDQALLMEDLEASLAHAAMLTQTGILTAEEGALLQTGLKQLQAEAQADRLPVDLSAEDVHTFVEAELTHRLGAVAGKLHTARSRNDQVATDFRLKTARLIDGLLTALNELITVIADQAQAHRHTLMPGLTHLQAAQPVTLAHHLLAWGFALSRDRERLLAAKVHVLENPLGACALAGTTFPIDRNQTTQALGFHKPMENSMDAVSARDFWLETLSALAILQVQFSRMGEELVLWSSVPYSYIRLGEAYTTGSSIMPQKINPDLAELVRGKSAQVIGQCMQGLTLMKGLPLSYSKDLQEDKGCLFEAFDTTYQSTQILAGMLKTWTVFPERMRQATEAGYLQATDLADYLVRKSVPFREAHHLAAQVVGVAMATGKTLPDLSLEAYQSVSPLFEADIYPLIDLNRLVEQRTSLGGPASACTLEQIKVLRAKIAD